MGMLAKASATRLWCFRQRSLRLSRTQEGAKRRMPRTNSTAVRVPSWLMSTSSNSILVSCSENWTLERTLCSSSGVCSFSAMLCLLPAVFLGDACVGDECVGDACVGDACVGVACVSCLLLPPPSFPSPS